MKLSMLIVIWECDTFPLYTYNDSPWKSCGVQSLGKSKDTLVLNMTATDGTGDAEKWKTWSALLFLFCDSFLRILDLFS